SFDRSNWRAWDEWFKGTYYTSLFMQFELSLDYAGDAEEGMPAVLAYRLPDWRHEGPYDHWGLPSYPQQEVELPVDPKTSFEDEDEILALDPFPTVTPVATPGYNLDPRWYGHTFKTGPEKMKVSQLGRYYVTGNRAPHKLALVQGSSVVAEATIQP